MGLNIREIVKKQSNVLPAEMFFRCKILVGMYRKCYTHTGDHLKNLGSCDANWDKLGGFVAGCPDSVVTVHDSVNHVVDRAEPST